MLFSLLIHLMVLGGMALYTGRRGQKPAVRRVYTVYMVHLPATDRQPHWSTPPSPVRPLVEEKKKRPPLAKPRPTIPARKTVRKKRSPPASTGTPKGKAAEQAGLRLDVASFPFPDYLYTLKARIEKNWHIPYTETPSGVERATVFFQILRDGRIARVFVEDRSGGMTFDQAALNAVVNSAPFAPLPEKFPGEYLGVHFEFEYEESLD